MKQFFKFMFASILGFLLTIFLLFLIGGGILASLASSADQSAEPEVKENSILHIELKNEIKDRPSNNPFENFDFAALEDRSPLSLGKLINTIEKASKDDRIKGIYLDISTLKANMSTTDAIRKALAQFKESGKFIIAYSENYSQNEYYLNSIADEVYLHPAGEMNFKGLAAQLMFFKDALGRIEVDMQVIRHGKFKSAIEPFIRNDMSTENREQLRKLVGGIWDHQLSEISSARNIDIPTLNKIADSLLVRTANNALELKLVDGLLYEDELMALLKTRVNGDDTSIENEVEELTEGEESKVTKSKKKDDLNLVALGQLSKVRKLQTSKESDSRIDRKSRNKIAVVYAEGEIVSGKSKDGMMGSVTIAEAIRDARKDKSIKAIVLRVNSPGGSALASDVIWRESVLAKAEKPFVVSMGDVAASGGYYISCGADRIFAQEATITGSIGVFGVIPNMKGMLNNKLGIHVDQVGTNAYSDGLTLLRPMASTERSAIQDMIEHIYDDFTSKVADGRGMSQAEVDNIGQGRVWSGIDAKEIGLVDELGGLADAINAAADMAELSDYKLKDLPKQEDPMEKLIQELSNQAYVKMFGNPMLGKAEKYYRSFQQVFEAEGIYTRLPVDIIID